MVAKQQNYLEPEHSENKTVRSMRIEDTALLKETILDVTKPVFIFSQNGETTISKEPVSTDFTVYVPALGPDNLGDKRFKNRHGLQFPYIAGAMANGISSAAMVKAMGQNGMMGFFGAGGLSPGQIEANVIDIKKALPDQPYGFNLIHSLGDPALEMATVKLYLKHGIRQVSAAAFMRMTPALVYYRVKGLHRGPDGSIVAPNHVIAKVSRIEIARQFFSPPPPKLIDHLLEQDLITRQEAELSQKIPMAQDLTAEADSGGHTDNRPALALLPTMIALRDQFMAEYNYDQGLCVGMGGGVSTPESAAAAFAMGAAYILTGSVNQSCVEAGICDEVKKLLCTAQQADVAMAPAADMFEIGARVQVLKRGTLFPVRAEKLYKYYQGYDRFEDIPEKARQEIESKILQSGFQDAWQSTRDFFVRINKSEEIERAEKDPRHKMALVFRSYLGLSSKWAISGVPERRMDYQIWCGPAIGAFNQWVKNSFLEHHENRRVDVVALNLLLGACVSIRSSMLRFQGLDLQGVDLSYKALEKDKILALISQCH